jgi:hypothetical protein
VGSFEIWVAREDILQTRDEALMKVVKEYEVNHRTELEADGFDTRSAYDAPLLGKEGSFSKLLTGSRASGPSSHGGSAGSGVAKSTQAAEEEVDLDLDEESKCAGDSQTNVPERASVELVPAQDCEEQKVDGESVVSTTSSYQRFLDAMKRDDSNAATGEGAESRTTKLALLQMKRNRLAKPAGGVVGDVTLKTKSKRKKRVRKRRQSEIDRAFDARVMRRVAPTSTAPWDVKRDELLKHECKYNFETFGLSLMYLIKSAADGTEGWISRDDLLAEHDADIAKMVQEYEARNRDQLDAEGFDTDILYDIPALSGQDSSENAPASEQMREKDSGYDTRLGERDEVIGGDDASSEVLSVPLTDTNAHSIQLPKVPVPNLDLKAAGITCSTMSPRCPATAPVADTDTNDLDESTEPCS